MKLYKKLGAKKFQEVVFAVERAKYKTIKTLFPNYIKYYDKYIDFQKKRALKKAKNDSERETIIENSKLAKMAIRKEFNQEKNRNYHMDSKNPTEIYKYLEWNKGVHKRGLIKNAILTPLFLGGSIIGIPGALPLLVIELISAGVNFECINIQNYNICRYKIIEESLIKKQQRQEHRDIEEYGEAAEVIYQTVKQKEELPSLEEIIANAKSKKQLLQLRELIKKEQQERKTQKEESVVYKKGELK